MISFLRSNLSAQNPAKGDRKKVGRKPKMMDSAIMRPEVGFQGDVPENGILDQRRTKQ